MTTLQTNTQNNLGMFFSCFTSGSCTLAEYTKLCMVWQTNIRNMLWAGGDYSAPQTYGWRWWCRLPGPPRCTKDSNGRITAGVERCCACYHRTPTRGSASGPRLGTSVPQTPCALPTSKSWLRHCCPIHVLGRFFLLKILQLKRFRLSSSALRHLN